MILNALPIRDDRAATMADNGIAKVQHHVPQFLLRQFGTGQKDQLHAFDKATGRTFVTNAKNAASESHSTASRLTRPS
ncbi:DUF4238 domain-containing protein [Pelomonas sp. Root1444]|uniref:DUF4238 domain-containing protein n=1 Tax=Pelomonas sp. Root1444 TaxID=1736464 RepID=UPI0007027C00|nr:DUF4238 domain-containing protein [Pelomonas sp. Root1444]KQY90736.1 hypothetical protein ASD35_02720 [Pelomonas sp. Root1444]